jgi:hypothetical protein
MIIAQEVAESWTQPTVIGGALAALLGFERVILHRSNRSRLDKIEALQEEQGRTLHSILCTLLRRPEK